ncbi:hypothetical protein BH10PSE9_BH10PSE9_05680 [soil metagenome]
MVKRTLATALLALGAAVALHAIANAYPSWTSASVNQRSGPGVGYYSLGALPPGTQVDVHYCQSAWCEVSSFLGVGWVSASYLGGGARVLPPPPPFFAQPYPYPYPYRVYPRVYRPSPGPFFQFSIGPRRW